VYRRKPEIGAKSFGDVGDFAEGVSGGVPFESFLIFTTGDRAPAKNAEVQFGAEEYSRFVLLRFMALPDEPITDAFAGG
jgi:hypothetical protein